MSDGAAAAPIKDVGPDAAAGGAGAVQIRMMALPDEDADEDENAEGGGVNAPDGASRGFREHTLEECG